MGEVQLFGKYLKYVITLSDQPASVNVGQEQPHDAFRLLMNIQVTLHVLKKVTDERTGQDRTKNKDIYLLEQKQLGLPGLLGLSIARKSFQDSPSSTRCDR